MEVLLNENENLKTQLLSTLKRKSNEDNFGVGGLLKDLVECAKQNSGKSKYRNTYSEHLKSLGELTYILGGVQLYQLYSLNLPFPSLSLIRKKVHSTQFIKEGEYRFKELKEFLSTRDYPMKIVSSEDGTRINGRILYHPGANQVVGFVLPLDDNRLPIVGSYPATSAKTMEEYFKNDVSNYAYAVMARPLVPGAPSFCLALFGTSNKFSGSQVLKRWRWERERLAEEGIELYAKATDGDSRMMKAMRCLTITESPNTSWKWFQSKFDSEIICLQDFVHILVKLKSRFFKPSVILPLGPKYLACKGHLVELVQVVSKDLHGIVPSYLANKDKMNFRSAEKICSEDVTKLLLSSVNSSLGTVTYLEMMRETFTSLADPSLSPLERVKMLWKWVFFLRIWKQWLSSKKDYTLERNFITSNAYMCIELNAHALVKLIMKLRDSEQCHLFRPWHFNSQDSEDLFRSLRSLSTVFNTVVNFAFLEMSHKIRRMECMQKAFFHLKDRYTFPGNIRAFEGVKKNEFVCISLPENYEIEHTIQEAFRQAVEISSKLNLCSRKLKKIPDSQLPFMMSEAIDSHAEGEEDENDADDLVITGEETDSESTAAALADQEINEIADVEEDLVVSTGDIGVKTYQNINLSVSSPFVKVRDSKGKESVIRKSTLLWLLSSGDTSLSSDRLLRVRSAEVRHINGHGELDCPVVKNKITVGSWCAFVSEDQSIHIGRVESFSYLSGFSWQNQEYAGSEAPVEKQGSARQLGCMCTWFRIKKNNFLQEIGMDSHGYYSLENYICTIPRPDTSHKMLKLTCSLKSITDLREN